MNRSKFLILGLFLIALTQADPAAAIVCKPAAQTPAYKPWQVTESKQEGVSLPDQPIQKTWKYSISWKPALTKAGGTLVKTYRLKAYGCPSHTYACTDARCNAEITGCFMNTSYVDIVADFGVSVAGVRLGVIFKPGYPCD